jgi:hypothetical protein
MFSPPFGRKSAITVEVTSLSGDPFWSQHNEKYLVLFARHFRTGAAGGLSSELGTATTRIMTDTTVAPSHQGDIT